MFQLIEDHGALLAQSAAVTPALWYGHPVYLTYRTHVMALLNELVGQRRSPYLADVLLAALDPDLVLYQREFLGLTADDLNQGWSELIESL